MCPNFASNIKQIWNWIHSNLHKDIFACLVSIHNIISLSCHEQVCLSGLSVSCHEQVCLSLLNINCEAELANNS